MAPCPLCRRGALRSIAAMTQESVMTRLLRHRTLASVPPRSAPARARQATFDWAAEAHDVARGLESDVRTVAVIRPSPCARLGAPLRWVESLLGWAVIATQWPTPGPWLLCLDLDLRNAFLGEANLLGGSLREVELPAWHIRTTVINRDSDRLAGFEIGHFGLRPQRECPMGRSQGVLIERLAARRLLAVETRSIPGGCDDLGGLGFAWGSGLLVCRGSRRGSGLLVCRGDRRKQYGLLFQATSPYAPQQCDADDVTPPQRLVHERHG